MAGAAHIETERKFLLRSNGWRAGVTASATIEQAYVAMADRATVRVRRYGDKGFVTVKGRRSGVSRVELETEVTLDFARALLRSDLLELPPLVKTRHLVPVEGLLFEIDEFAGRNAGLVIAELELQDAFQDYPRPPWLGDEVSGDRRYSNSALARHPYLDW